MGASMLTQTLGMILLHSNGPRHRRAATLEMLLGAEDLLHTGYDAVPTSKDMISVGKKSLNPIIELGKAGALFQVQVSNVIPKHGFEVRRGSLFCSSISENKQTNWFVKDTIQNLKTNVQETGWVIAYEPDTKDKWPPQHKGKLGGVLAAV